MDMNFNLSLQQEQKLIMTPELQLSVKILQMPAFELCEYINEQLMENPMLEAEENRREVKDNLQALCDEIQYDYSGVKDCYDRGYGGYKEAQEEGAYTNPFNYIIKEKSIWEYLKEQLSVAELSSNMTYAGEYIIDNIDDNGYLTVDLDIISKFCRIEMKKAQQVLNTIQTFEPAGIAARSIEECLILQLKRNGNTDKVLLKIISSMLEDVANGDVRKISKQCCISIDKAEEYIAIIKKLNPRPGAAFLSESIKYIVPEVSIEKENGTYVVIINEEYIPHLRINDTYRKMLTNKDSEEYLYLKEKVHSAIWVIKSVIQRQNTIKAVTEAILKYQYSFFENDGQLKPMTLKSISQATGYHESTVSRAVNGKYIQTPRGVFQIKGLFVRSIQNSIGEEVAVSRIKETIKEIINSEAHNKPYSDQSIADMLLSQGMTVSRRTVAKYREEMYIPSSSKRRR